MVELKITVAITIAVSTGFLSLLFYLLKHSEYDIKIIFRRKENK